MAVRQLSNRLPAAFLQFRHAATAGQEGIQQHCGQHTDLFRKLLSGFQKDAQRHYSQAFVPSRLYPKRHQSSEAMAFWGIISLNVATTILAKSDHPEVKHLVSQYFKTSVAAVAEGRWYTVLTSSVCHTSVVHCALNLLLLAVYRRTQPLGAAEVSRCCHSINNCCSVLSSTHAAMCSALSSIFCCLCWNLAMAHTLPMHSTLWPIEATFQYCFLCRWLCTDYALCCIVMSAAADAVCPGRACWQCHTPGLLLV